MFYFFAFFKISWYNRLDILISIFYMKEIYIEADTNFNDLKKELIEIKQDTGLEIWFNYISDFKGAKILRDIISEICSLYNISDNFMSRLILLVDELNNNAIEYGSLNLDTNIMYVKIDKTKDLINIKIEVTDSWKWKSAKHAIDMEEIRKQRLEVWFNNHSSIRWRWLFMIIEKIADKLYFKDAIKWWLTVWIEKTLKI